MDSVNDTDIARMVDDGFLLAFVESSALHAGTSETPKGRLRALEGGAVGFCGKSTL